MTKSALCALFIMDCGVGTKIIHYKLQIILTIQSFGTYYK